MWSAAHLFFEHYFADALRRVFRDACVGQRNRHFSPALWPARFRAEALGLTIHSPKIEMEIARVTLADFRTQSVEAPTPDASDNVLALVPGTQRLDLFGPLGPLGLHGPRKEGQYSRQGCEDRTCHLADMETPSPPLPLLP